MNKAEIAGMIKAAIVDIAPDADPEAIAVEDDMREELDLDSMDFLNIIIAVAKKTGVDIPASDYARVLTLEDMCEYIAARLK